MALRATDADENPQGPITNRPPDAIRPHKRFNRRQAFGCTFVGQAFSLRPAAAGPPEI
jgi:hypothetical protein